MVFEPQPTTVSRPLPIQPDFDWDYTEQWGDRIAPGLSPGAYQRYAPPRSREVCLKQIEALTETIGSIADNIDARRDEAATLAEQDLECDEVQRGLRRAGDAKRKYEAARSAYLHWLKAEDGVPEEPPAPAPSGINAVPNMRERVTALTEAVRILAETYRADLAETIDVREAEEAVGQVLALLETAEQVN
jgi:hypothetical protein